MTQPFSTVNVLGFDFIKATQQEFVEQLKKDSLSHKNRFVVTANPEIVLTALNDPEYSSVIKGADYLTADGIGIVKGAKILGSSLPGRVTDAIWMGIGGSFDVLAGYAERAPQWWIDHHIEWLYRLYKEPTRFLRMMALPKYLLLVYRYKFFGK